MKVILDVIKGPDQGKRFEFKEPDTFLVGRGNDVHFQLLHDPYVSRRHFHLEISPPNCLARDLNSKSGIRVNGMIVAEQLLRDGDVIEVGFTYLKVGIELRLETRTARCRRCGANLVLVGQEQAAHCDKCAQETSRQSAAAAAAQATTASCWQCGIDLTKLANSDGRLAELGGITYCCPRCLPAREEGSKKHIGDYQIIKKIGEGGMGKVYLAYQPETARLLAIKQMLRLDIEELAARFQREIRINGEIIHPNIIRSIDCGRDRDGPYLVTEFATGGNLTDLLKKRMGPLPPAEATGFIVEALKGLDHIHQRQIIHRDIKAENILLQKTNGRLAAKITDFGLAKKYGESGGTKVNTFLGTFVYSPPEQHLNTRDVRETADIYAMGITLYYLLTGKFPYRFPSDLEILLFMLKTAHKFNNAGAALRVMMEREQLAHPVNIILSNDPTPIREKNPAIPTQLATAVDKAIRKEIAARYQSATEFIGAIQTAA